MTNVRVEVFNLNDLMSIGRPPKLHDTELHGSEVYKERPSDVLARGQVWSNYKHHSTVKFFIGITHHVSKPYGEQEQSNLIDYLEPGI